MPRSAPSRSTPSTAGVGTMTKARSTGPGISASERKDGSPCTVPPFGLTRCTSPGKPNWRRLAKVFTDQPDLSVAPTSAIARGENSAARPAGSAPSAACCADRSSMSMLTAAGSCLRGRSLADLPQLGVPLEQVAGDRAALDLVGALEDPQQPQFAVPALDRQFLGV